MPKRFTGTEKWGKEWFQRLSTKQKCLWFYLCDNCDVAGFWEENFRQATFQMDVEISREDLSNLKDVREVLDGVWFITDFVEFQYGVTRNQLNVQNKAHRAVIRCFDKWESKGALKGLQRGLEAPKDKDKDKDMDKDKDKDKDMIKTRKKYTCRIHPEVGSFDNPLGCPKCFVPLPESNSP